MESILLIVVVAIVLVAVVIFVRRNKGALPPPESHEKAAPTLPAEAAKPAAAKPAEAPKPVQAQPSEAKAAEAKPAEAAPTTAVAARAEPVAAPAVAPIKPVAVVQTAPVKTISTPPPAAKAPTAEEEISALRKGLGATRGGLVARLKSLFGRKPEIDPTVLEEVEEILLTSDVGVKTSHAILGRLRESLERNELSSSDRVFEALRAEARTILDRGAGAMKLPSSPSVVLFVGVNGVGKTTTIGKLASKLKDSGKKVLLVAGDTYRAAAVVQLEAWGRRVGCDVVKGKDRADPSAVMFDAVQKAKDQGYDVVLCDTAGRLHTKTPLMDELSKIGRTIEKALGRPADEVLLVLDSTTGQNAMQQAQIFREALPLSGIVLTKLDGTAKGGVILGIVDEHSIPVRYVGIGERVEDLREFAPGPFVEALFDRSDDDVAT